MTEACQEVTTQTGHRLALGIHPGQVVEWRYRVQDETVDRHLDQVHQSGGLCVAAHLHAPYASGEFMCPYQGFDVWLRCGTGDGPRTGRGTPTMRRQWPNGLQPGCRHPRWVVAAGDGQQRHPSGTSPTARSWATPRPARTPVAAAVHWRQEIGVGAVISQAPVGLARSTPVALRG
jgi:hypothetical protein